MLGRNISTLMEQVFWEKNNHFLIIFKIHNIRWKPYMILLKWIGIWGKLGHWTVVKSATIIMLKEHSNKITLNEYFYNHRSMSCSMCIIKLLVVDDNYKSNQQLDDIERMKDLGALYSKWDVFSKPLPLRLKDLCIQRQKDCKR